MLIIFMLNTLCFTVKTNQTPDSDELEKEKQNVLLNGFSRRRLLAVHHFFDWYFRKQAHMHGFVFYLFFIRVQL